MLTIIVLAWENIIKTHDDKKNTIIIGKLIRTITFQLIKLLNRVKNIDAINNTSTNKLVSEVILKICSLGSKKLSIFDISSFKI